MAKQEQRLQIGHPNQTKTYDEYIVGPVNTMYRFARYQTSRMTQMRRYHTHMEGAHRLSQPLPRIAVDSLERHVDELLALQWESYVANTPSDKMKPAQMWGMLNPLDYSGRH